jgi:hypothetical protein
MQQQPTKLPAFDKPLFDLGKLAVTRGVYEIVTSGELSPAGYLRRHQAGDWGEMCPSDWSRNNRALHTDPEKRDRLMSAYTTAAGTKIWIITEWDRGVTTILLPDEY